MPPPKWIWKMQVVASSLCSMLCLRIYWLPFVATRWWDETCESFQLEYGHVECTTDPKPQMLPKIPIIHVPLYQFSCFHPFHNLSNAMKLKYCLILRRVYLLQVLHPSRSSAWVFTLEDGLSRVQYWHWTGCLRIPGCTQTLILAVKKVWHPKYGRLIGHWWCIMIYLYLAVSTPMWGKKTSQSGSSTPGILCEN